MLLLLLLDSHIATRGEAGNTVFPEVVDVEADVPLPLLHQPAEIEERFPGGEGDVCRGRCQILTLREGVIDPARLEPFGRLHTLLC